MRLKTRTACEEHILITAVDILIILTSAALKSNTAQV